MNCSTCKKPITDEVGSSYYIDLNHHNFPQSTQPYCSRECLRKAGEEKLIYDYRDVIEVKIRKKK